MAYMPRNKIIYDGAFFHVTWLCHNGEWFLKWRWAKQAYYDFLLKYKDKYKVKIHSYNFMDNHPHLAGQLETREQFSRFFQQVNSLFARFVNKRLKRRGQVIMDRFKSPVIESDNHMLTVMAYIDLNQHRAKKVSHPKHNKWSSYRYYAYGEEDPLITSAPSYLGLSEDPIERQKEYRAIVGDLIEHRKVINISHTHFIGNPEWVLGKYRELCEMLGRKLTEPMFLRLTSPPG
jgi:putative transposase